MKKSWPRSLSDLSKYHNIILSCYKHIYLQYIWSIVVDTILKKTPSFRAGFTYLLDRLKHRSSRCILSFTLSLAKPMYSLNNPSVISLAQLHSISEYCRMVNTRHHPRFNSNWLNTRPSSSSREGGGLGGV